MMVPDHRFRGSPQELPRADREPAALRLDPLTGRPGIRVTGEINLLTREHWESALDQVLVSQADVHLELSELSFVDAGGAAALAAAAQRLGDGHRLVLHDPPAGLRRILELLWPGMPEIEVSSR